MTHRKSPVEVKKTMTWKKYQSHGHGTLFSLINSFIFILFLIVLGLCCCMWACSGGGEWGLLFAVFHWLLLLWSTGLRQVGSNNCGAQA